MKWKQREKPRKVIYEGLEVTESFFVWVPTFFRLDGHWRWLSWVTLDIKYYYHAGWFYYEPPSWDERIMAIRDGKNVPKPPQEDEWPQN